MSPSWTSHGPISLSGTSALHHAAGDSAQLLVHAQRDANGLAKISQQAAVQLLGTAAAVGRALLCLAIGSDCVMSCEVDASLTGNSIALTEVQAFNLHTAPGCVEEFKVFEPPSGQPFELVEVEAEVSVLGRAQEEVVQLDAGLLAAQFGREYLGRVVAVNEACVLQHAGQQVLLRIAATDSLVQEEREESIGHHCFRGLVVPGTQLYLVSAAEAGCSQNGRAASSMAPQTLLAHRARVVLHKARQRPAAGISYNTVQVLTNDGEVFPVLRKLLRPCITLTSVVRSPEPSPSTSVDIDTSTFDRVLLFLEAHVLGKEPPGFGIHLISGLADAANKLGLRPLQEFCQQRLGAAEARRRLYSYEEIKQHNAQGGCYLILDGMVLDVGHWLPEHPGGSKIIPAQALNLDCSRMFEIYHATRESYIYIESFYLGELVPEDRRLLPPTEQPSIDFLEQLQQFTQFRMPVGQARTHLGVKDCALSDGRQCSI